MLTTEELKQLIIDNYDPDLFLETMEVSIEELVDRFTEEIEDRRFLFDHLLDYEESYDEYDD